MINVQLIHINAANFGIKKSRGMETPQLWGDEL